MRTRRQEGRSERHRSPVFRLSFLPEELIVDGFAGGGGASNGIEAALGRHVDIAINHDPIALAVHAANHPHTEHIVSDVWEVDPVVACRGRRVGLAWFSPACTHFSKAKGSANPLCAKIRSLAWVVVRWARTVRPRVCVVENVEEFAKWGPLDEHGRPNKAKAGQTFRAWLSKMRKLGYTHDFRELVAADFGSATIRKRLIVIFRCDRQPIVWPEPSHGPGRAEPYRTAAECIDWTKEGRSIFGRKKPLKEATLRRIAAGLERYVFNGRPFIMPVTHQGDARTHGVDEPLRTVTGAHRGELAVCVAEIARCAPETHEDEYRRTKYHGGAEAQQAERTALCTPYLVRHGHYSTITGAGLREGCGAGTFRGQPLTAPMSTVCATDDRHLVMPVIVPHYGGAVGHPCAPRSVGAPLGTVTRVDHTSLVCAWVTKFFGTARHGAACTDPLPTVTTGGGRGGGHLGVVEVHGEPIGAEREKQRARVRAFIVKYYSGGKGPKGRKNGARQVQSVDEPLHTATVKARFGLVTIDGQDYEIVDIRMRMLQPGELAKAMDFENYDFSAARTKTKETALIGNSVCKRVAEAIVRVNAGGPVGQLGLFGRAAA